MPVLFCVILHSELSSFWDLEATSALFFWIRLGLHKIVLINLLVWLLHDTGFVLLSLSSLLQCLPTPPANFWQVLKAEASKPFQFWENREDSKQQHRCCGKKLSPAGLAWPRNILQLQTRQRMHKQLTAACRKKLRALQSERIKRMQVTRMQLGKSEESLWYLWWGNPANTVHRLETNPLLFVLGSLYDGVI